LLGFDGVMENKDRVPCPVSNLIVEKMDQRRLYHGAVLFIASIKKRYPRWNQRKIADKIIRGELNFDKLDEVSGDEAVILLKPWIDRSIRHIDKMRYKKEEMREKYGSSRAPLRHVIVTTGDINKDIKIAVEAANNGADVISIMCSSDQSVMDHVPISTVPNRANKGIFINQDGFRAMRAALDDVSKKLKRYIRLCSSSTGLCMPEIAVIAAMEGLDYLSSDALYGSLFWDINLKRSLIDQFFSRVIIARSGMILNTGEDNFFNTEDSYNNHHEILTSHFINDCFAKHAGLRDDQVSLGHDFEMSANAEDSFVLELAMAQLVREAFPRCPTKYMAPKQSKSNKVPMNNILDTLFNVAGMITEQRTHSLGVLTEMSQVNDRFLSLQETNNIFHAMRALNDEVVFSANGKIMRHARQVLDRTHKFLKQISDISFFNAVERGLFANISRSKDRGEGCNGIFEKSRRYINPFAELMAHAQNNRYSR